MYGTKFADLQLWDPSSARVLAVSGGWILEEIERGVIPGQLAEAKAIGGDQLILAGIDSGSLLLGAAGLIDGRPATTHRADYERLAEWAADIVALEQWAGRDRQGTVWRRPAG